MNKIKYICQNFHILEFADQLIIFGVLALVGVSILSALLMIGTGMGFWGYLLCIVCPLVLGIRMFVWSAEKTVMQAERSRK